MIKIENLSKKFPSTLALDKLNFEVKKGEVLGFLGPNGAGKTTTMKIITGFWQPTKGRVLVDGKDVVEHPMATRRKIGYLPESVPLYDDMKVYEYLRFIAEVRDIESDKMLDRIKEVSQLCGLRDVTGKSLDELSKGYRQRVGLAQAIMHDPDILILDEPTTGLDPNQIVEIRNLIKAIGRQKTVIFSTHILAEAQATCDRVVIINKGSIVGQGEPQELAGKLQGHGSYYIKLKAPQESVLAVFRELRDIKSVTVKDKEAADIAGYVIEPGTGSDIREVVARQAMEKGWPVLEFTGIKASLEEVFRQLTK